MGLLLKPNYNPEKSEPLFISNYDFMNIDGGSVGIEVNHTAFLLHILRKLIILNFINTYNFINP